MKSPSLNTYINTSVFALVLLCLLAALYGESISKIGFLSDDWSLIHRAAFNPFWLPAEQHHYSPVINLMFKAVALGYLTPFSIHMMAFVMHAVNAFIVYFFARDLLEYQSFASMLIASLFALSPAGLEAIVWCCAIGYIFCAFWILLAVYIFCKAGTRLLTFSQACVLGVLQLGAFLCWDWGIVLAPSLAALCFVSSNAVETNLSLKRLYSLWPVLVIWVAVVFFKRSFEQDFGYAINTPGQILANFITVPLLSVVPQFTKVFYTSFIGMVSAILCFGAILWTALRSPHARVLLVLLIVWSLPLALLGYPQSRYFYLLTFPVYCIAVQFFKEIGKFFTVKSLGRVGFVLGVGILSLYFLWSKERVMWWEKASQESVSLYNQIEVVTKQEVKPLAIVNMPDRYGPVGMIWLPYLWRCGLVHFTHPFSQVHTPECLHLPTDAMLIPREEIAARYSQYALYEVKFVKERQTLQLVKFEET